MTKKTHSLHAVLTATALFASLSAASMGIAAAQSAPAAPEPAGEYRVLSGPGGRQLIEVPMPQGFEPIRLVGLKGTPVTGHPVMQRTGELNPQNWEQLDLGEVDANFQRLMGSLRLRSEPKLLQGMTFAESFAKTHLDERTFGEFFPTASAGSFGTNEFERKNLFEKFLARYDASLQAGLPSLPFEFIYIEQVLLGTYDTAQKSFPIANAQGESGRTTLNSFAGAMMHANTPWIEVPASLAMDETEAEALLERVPDERSLAATTLSSRPIRHVYRGMRLAITGFTVARNGQTDTVIERRSISLFEDPLLTRPIHEYVVEEQVVQESVRLDASLLLPHLPNLYAMRDLEGYLDDEGVATGSKYLVKAEQFQADPRAMGVLCGDKRSAFEWATARPELANGPLLDLLLDPAADWSFLDTETRFGLVADHCVALFVFPKDKIAGRQVDFAAAEMAPVYRRALEAAITRLPKKVYITRRLTKPAYDHAGKVLTFEAPAGNGVPGRSAELLGAPYRGVEYLTPGETPKTNSGAVVVAPKDAEGLAFYSLETTTSGNEAVAPPSLRPKSTQGGDHSVHGSAWRDSVRWFRGERRDEPNALALDRRLSYPGVPLDPATAERLITDAADYGKSPRAVIVLEIDKTRRVAPGQRGILFAHLDRVLIVAHDGRQVAVLDAASFPDAVAADSERKAEAQAKQNAAATAAAAKSAAREASVAEADASRASGLAACDGESSTAQERLTCYQAFCAGRQGDYECFKKVQYAQIVASTERAEAAGSSAEHRGQCMMRARRKWGMTEASEEYDRVVQNCLAQTNREPYGPDILGLRLGMKKSDADLIRRRELNVKSGQMRHAAESLLFDEGTIYFSADNSHLLAIENLDSFGHPLAAVIGRRIHFGGPGQPIDTLLDSMLGKYGAPVWRDDRHVLWTFAQNGQATSGAPLQKCSKLAAMLADPQWSGMSQRDVEISKLAPPTISGQLRRADYAAFSDCGVVLVARFGLLPGGAVGDASMVMFDPAWIAQQPDIAFSDPGKKEAGLRF